MSPVRNNTSGPMIGDWSNYESTRQIIPRYVSSNVIKIWSLPRHQCHFSKTMKTCYLIMSRVMTCQHMLRQPAVLSSKIRHVGRHYYRSWGMRVSPSSHRWWRSLYRGIARDNCSFRYPGVARFPIFQSIDSKIDIMYKSQTKTKIQDYIY